jgi:hypothetical protein
MTVPPARAAAGESTADPDGGWIVARTGGVG